MEFSLFPWIQMLYNCQILFELFKLLWIVKVTLGFSQFLLSVFNFLSTLLILPVKGSMGLSLWRFRTLQEVQAEWLNFVKNSFVANFIPLILEGDLLNCLQNLDKISLVMPIFTKDPRMKLAENNSSISKNQIPKVHKLGTNAREGLN